MRGSIRSRAGWKIDEHPGGTMNKPRHPLDKPSRSPRSAMAGSALGPGYSAANSNTRIHGPRPFTLPSNSAKPPAAPATVNLGLNSDRLRLQMVQLLREQCITDARLLSAMQALPRHVFLD